MMSKRMVFALFACILLHMNWTLGKNDDKTIEKDGYLNCSQCRSGKNVNRTIPVNVAKRMHRTVVNSFEQSKPFTNSTDFRKYMLNCKTCDVGFTICTATEGQNFLTCTKKIATFSVKSSKKGSERNVSRKSVTKRSVNSLPHVIDIPIGGLKNHSRQLRSPATCSFPTAMNTAAIKCKVFPNSISCVQRCAFGYTLPRGIRQSMNCSLKENKWRPNGFEECRPFVDCTLSLISGGSATCASMELRKGPECRVECLNFEDKEALPEETYSCDIEGKWSPPLPFCASPETGLMLVPPPQIKVHGPPKQQVQ